MVLITNPLKITQFVLSSPHGQSHFVKHSHLIKVSHSATLVSRLADLKKEAYLRLEQSYDAYAAKLGEITGKTRVFPCGMLKHLAKGFC